MSNEKIKLTRFSHGAGCGCKISPAVLDIILKNNNAGPSFLKNESGNTFHNKYKSLLVGNSSRDDAAVFDLGNGTALISTTDFFMPIVDDAFDFGKIASANAISDVYAMGGTPLMAIAILGWPIEKINPEIAAEIIAGAKALCSEAGIPLAGGHSIDSPEPIFGLAVNGIVKIENIKRNDTASEGDLLFLTKPLGIGILSTASKKELLKEEDGKQAIQQMTTLNKIGEELGKLKGVNALTDVTGFGLLGHLCEMAEGSNLTAEIRAVEIPIMDSVNFYLEKNCIPGGTNRNWKSYGHKISSVSERLRLLLADPQTSGGLLVSVAPDSLDDYFKVIKAFGCESIASNPIGVMKKKSDFAVRVIE